MGIKSRDWRNGLDRWRDEMDRSDGFDPQILERFLVPLGDEALGYSESSDEVETPEPDQSALLAAVGTIIDNVLTPQERNVLLSRCFTGMTYERIAKESRPRLSGPSQAKKIELRAIRKLRELRQRLLEKSKNAEDI
jgi:hypothetical protein